MLGSASVCGLLFFVSSVFISWSVFVLMLRFVGVSIIWSPGSLSVWMSVIISSALFVFWSGFVCACLFIIGVLSFVSLACVFCTTLVTFLYLFLLPFPSLPLPSLCSGEGAGFGGWGSVVPKRFL